MGFCEQPPAKAGGCSRVVMVSDRALTPRSLESCVGRESRRTCRSHPAMSTHTFGQKATFPVSL